MMPVTIDQVTNIGLKLISNILFDIIFILINLNKNKIKKSSVHSFLFL